MRHFCVGFAVLVLLQGVLPAISTDVPEKREPEKRQLVTGLLSAALPSLSNLLLKETHLDQFIGKAVNWVTSFFDGQSGDMPLEGTQLKLHYNVHHCSLHFGKRFLASKRCKAEVSEAHTKTSESCTEGSQKSALKCAVKKEIQKLTDLAKAAQAHETGKRQLVTGLLSAALPSLSNLLLKETHLDQFIGKAVNWVTSFFDGQSGDMPLEGTQLKLHYNVHHCSLHFGKRFLASKRCKAEVSEAHTKTSESCTEGSQKSALKCAVKKEIQKLTDLAKAAQAHETGKRQVVTGLLSAALPSLSNLLLKETHLDQFIGKAVNWVTSFFDGQSGDLSGFERGKLENLILKTFPYCLNGTLLISLKCALRREVQKLIAEAKADQTPQDKPTQANTALKQQQDESIIRNNRETESLSEALTSLNKLLQNTAHLFQYVAQLADLKPKTYDQHSGDIALEGTDIVLHYEVHKCIYFVGKRFLHGPDDCPVTVSEARTNLRKTCGSRSQQSSLNLCVKLIVQKLVDIAKTEKAKEFVQLEKRQVVTGLLSAALPSLSNLLLKETHLDQFIGKAVNWVTSFFDGQSGDMPLEGTQLKLHYNVHHCSLHFGKRFLASKRCKAEVSEAHTKTSESCTEGSQKSALKCAVKKEIQKLTDLAKAAQAAQG